MYSWNDSSLHNLSTGFCLRVSGYTQNDESSWLSYASRARLSSRISTFCKTYGFNQIVKTGKKVIEKSRNTLSIAFHKRTHTSVRDKISIGSFFRFKRIRYIHRMR